MFNEQYDLLLISGFYVKDLKMMINQMLISDSYLTTYGSDKSTFKWLVKSLNCAIIIVNSIFVELWRYDYTWNGTDRNDNDVSKFKR